MKVLLLRATARKEGITQYITDIALKGLIAGGAEVTDIDLFEKRIQHCDGCYNCWTVTPGKCKYRDDMDQLLELVLDNELILFSTPLHHYSMNAEMLKFIERTFPLTKQGFVDTPSGLLRNAIRFPERWGDKKIAFISAGGMRSVGNFDAMQKSFQLIAEGMGFRIVGEIMRPESFLLPYKFAKPRTIKNIENAIEKAGFQLATNGEVSKSVQETVYTPISANRENLIQHTNLFWEHVFNSKEKGLNQKAAQDTMVHDVRVLMREIVTYVDPIATKRVRAKIQFVFPDVGLSYLLEINRGTASLNNEIIENPDLKITVDQSIWASMFLREITPMEAISEKKILLQGDKTLFTRFDKYFPPPRN